MNTTMKKIYTFILTVVAFAFTACDVVTDIEPGGTSVEKMAGLWTVTIDAEGKVVIEDPYGLEYSQVSTYNTAANTATEMWLDDGENFWKYKLKVVVDYANRTFTSNGEKDNSYYESKVTVDGGKILEGAATTPSGMPADSIVFYVSFDDDDAPGDYGFNKYKVSGFRYTGFPADK